MDFTATQLRRLRTSIIDTPEARFVEPYEQLDPYGQDLPSAVMLSGLTTEAEVLRLNAIPEEPTPIKSIHGKLLDITGVSIKLLPYYNFAKSILSMPPELVRADPDAMTVAKLPMGFAATALGGYLLGDFSRPCNTRIREWTGARAIRGKGPLTGYSTAQVHRLHILRQLLPGRQIKTAEFASGSVELTFGSTKKLLSRLHDANIITRRVTRESTAIAWWKMPVPQRPVATRFLNMVASFSDPSNQYIEEGQALLDALHHPSSQSVISQLFMRGLMSTGHAIHPAHVTLNENLLGVYRLHDQTDLLGAEDLNPLLDARITTEKLQLLIERLGSTCVIEAVEVHEKGRKRIKFRRRRAFVNRFD